jgi:hypothetical protein
MEQHQIITFLGLIPLILFTFALGKALALKKENALLARQLTETCNSLELARQHLASLREKERQTDTFQHKLAGAELSTRINTFRTAGQNNERNRPTPEKYCYIHSLAQKGMSPDEIASVLTISTHEARQLVTLAKIAQGN